MTYYQVLPQYDNYVLPKRLIYIRHELFTPAETKRWKVDKSKCRRVRLSRKKTHFCFGARFANHNTHVKNYSDQI